MWHSTIAFLALFIHYVFAAPTWPSPVDEIEDLMVLQSGYRSLGFASVVTPCSNSLAKGFRIAAGFVRTAFHDVAAYDASAGTGGLDASIGFECSAPFSEHNSGPAFAGAMAYYTSFFNSKASMADLIALGTYVSVRSCGGPIVPMRAGRIDATGPGPNSLPDAADNQSTLVGRFAKMGFSPQEMIQLTACGHTLGGVHPGVNPSFDPQDPNAAAKAAEAGVLTFDETDDVFDNRVATEYISGTSQSPLIVGNPRLASDARVFSADGNVTIQSMTDPDVFDGSCQSVFQKMLERVPSNVQLSDVIQPYNFKPGQLNFNVLSDGSLVFSGEIRVRTTGGIQVAKIQLVYSDDSGNSCDGCVIDTTLAGNAQGYGDTFEFYGFSAKIDSISSFKVVATTTSGSTRIFDNNGEGFKVNDSAFVQVSSSSLSGSDLKVVVAVRAGGAQPEITLSTRSAFAFDQLPTISKRPGTVSKICGGSKWSYYSTTFTVASADVNSAKLDVSVGGVIVDGFRNINFPSSSEIPSCISSVSTTLSTSTISSTATASNSTITSSTISATNTTSTSSTSSTSSIVAIANVTSSTISSDAPFTNLISDLNATVISNTSSIITSTVSSTSSSLTTTASDPSFAIDPISFTGPSQTISSISGSGSKADNYTGASDPSKMSSKSSIVSVPAWSVWEKPTPSASSKASESGKTSGTGKVSSTLTGSAGSYATPDVANPKHDDGQAALASVYQSLANKPAPSGGTDGGDKNLEGLDLGIQVSAVKPTITGTTAVFTNTVVYVTTLANAQESANVYGNGGPAQGAGWGDWPGAADAQQGGSRPAQTTGAGSSSAQQSGSKPTQGTGAGAGAGAGAGGYAGAGAGAGASGSASASAGGYADAGAGAGSSGTSSSASVPGAWDSWNSAGSTPTRTGLVAQYTGAADTLRSGGVALGLAVVFGAVAIIL